MTRLLVFSFLLSSAVSAQTASLRGQVTDSSGAQLCRAPASCSPVAAKAAGNYTIQGRGSFVPVLKRIRHLLTTVEE